MLSNTVHSQHWNNTISVTSIHEIPPDRFEEKCPSRNFSTYAKLVANCTVEYHKCATFSCRDSILFPIIPRSSTRTDIVSAVYCNSE